ncbi:hypothetical protein C0J52_28310 [Blattella germanica]|nr:hypothetical protein C0J52_28310 [Blattella germanica]
MGDPTSPNASKSEGSYLAERLIWYPVGELSKENMHIQYLNIGQVIDTSLPSTYFNQHLGPVKINMAYDLHQDRMAFWDSLPLEENDGCVKCEASRHLQMSIVTITGCLCLWNSIYSTVFSFL